MKSVLAIALFVCLTEAFNMGGGLYGCNMYTCSQGYYCQMQFQRPICICRNGGMGGGMGNGMGGGIGGGMGGGIGGGGIGGGGIGGIGGGGIGGVGGGMCYHGYQYYPRNGMNGGMGGVGGFASAAEKKGPAKAIKP